jgi:hypothetical protein
MTVFVHLYCQAWRPYALAIRDMLELSYLVWGIGEY